jgi:hypothetical protein
MTNEADRELLEQAAKAAGLTLRWIGDGPSVPYTPEESAQRNGIDGYMWNPLIEDGDALRLVVKLNITVIKGLAMISGHPIREQFYEEDAVNADPYAATRRAIVRAAAAIGKEMP